MLRDLHIENIALIDDVWLEFGSGLTVLTGETGAGKTVLLSALELILGGRGDSEQIAAGADKAKVEAVFELGGDDDVGKLDESSELIVSRSMTVPAAKGGSRTRVLLNGELSTVGALQKQVGVLIDLHGQHDHQALLSAARHIEYLDRWAAEEIKPLHTSYTTARENWQKAQAELQQVEDMLTKSIEERDAGRIALAEIERIDPRTGEDDELRAKLPTLQNSQAIAELMSQAQESLRAEGAALERLYNLDDALEQVAAFDASVQELRETAREARHVLDGIADGIDDYAAQIRHDPRALEAAFERLSALESLAKRYGPTLDAVIERRQRLLALADVSENSDERLFEARDAEKETRLELQTSAKKLADARHTAAKDFTQQLLSAAADLELGKVRFTLDFKELPFAQWTASGSEKVEILYAPAPAVPPRPLTKIASGGEISRVMLALKSVLGEADNTATLIFDEVDAGIGGATGLAIGAKLKRLAQTHQVIVVTHLAQVAAYANAHFKVSKVDAEGGKVRTEVSALNKEERVHEIARMLSGSNSDTALCHAKELIESVQ